MYIHMNYTLGLVTYMSSDCSHGAGTVLRHAGVNLALDLPRAVCVSVNDPARSALLVSQKSH
jgi:hypothetical protein